MKEIDWNDWDFEEEPNNNKLENKIKQLNWEIFYIKTIINCSYPRNVLDLIKKRNELKKELYKLKKLI